VVTAHAIDGEPDRHRSAETAALVANRRTGTALQERRVPAPGYSSFLVATTFLPR
jgi:hypothetical protein